MTSLEHPAANFLSLNFFFKLDTSMSFVLFDGRIFAAARSDQSAHLPRRGLFPSRAPASRRSTRGFRIRGCRPHGSPHPRLRPLLKDAARSGSAPPDTPRNRYHEGFRRSPRIRPHLRIRVHSRTILTPPTVRPWRIWNGSLLYFLRSAMASSLVSFVCMILCLHTYKFSVTDMYLHSYQLSFLSV